MYYGKNPCLGCGRTGEERHRGMKDQLCWDCQEAIKAGYDVIKNKKRNEEEFASVTIANYSFRFLQTELPGPARKMPDKMPYVADGFEQDKKKDKDYPGSSRELLDAFANILQELNHGERPVKKRYWMEESWHENTYYIKKGIAKQIYDFVLCLSRYCNRIKREEFERGKNLLISLNSGEITLGELEGRR